MTEDTDPILVVTRVQKLAYAKTSQEISNLLKPKEQKNEQERPNIIRFGKTDTEN